MADHIEIVGLRAFGRHGVFEHERINGQTFVVDLRLETDLRDAGASDQLVDTVDYGALASRIAEEVGATRFDLIEALAGHLASVALEQERVQGVTVRVAKPSAPVTVELDEVAVVVHRQRTQPPVR